MISGYCAMHDLAKLFLADKFNLKIDFNVHETTIIVLKELARQEEVAEMLDLGYKEFTELLDDLSVARK